MLEALRKKWAALEAQRKALLDEGEALIRSTQVEGQERSLTPDEDTKITTLLGEARGIGEAMVELRAEIAALEAVERAIAETNATVPFQVNLNTGLTRGGTHEGEIRADTDRGEVRGRIEKILTAERAVSTRQAEILLDDLEAQPDGDVRLARHIQASSTREYRRAFGKIMTGQTYALTPEESRAVQAVRAASLTDAAGGFAIPFVLDPTIIDTRDGSVNPMRQVARIERITGDNWQGITSAGVTASWDAESEVVSDDSPTLAQPSITPHKGSVFVQYTMEIGQDWAGMEANIRTMFANAKEDLEAPAHVTGSGTNQPWGIVTRLIGTASELNAAGEALAAADLYALEAALGPRYRTRAKWLANKAIYTMVRQLDTNGGSQMWERIGAGQPGELLGYQALEASSMDGAINAAATANNYSVVFGDLSEYIIVDRMGMTVENIPHIFDPTTGRPKGHRGIYANWRTGGDFVNIKAARLLDIATTA